MMLKYFLSIYIVCFAGLIIAQKKDLNQWSAKMNDEKRAALAERIIFNYKYESLQTTDSVLTLIYTNKEVAAWNHLVRAEFEKARSNYTLASSYLDSCIQSSNTDYLTINAYCKQAITNTLSGQLGKALDNFQMALDLSKDPKYVILRAGIYAAMGEFYRKTSNFDVAFEYLDSAQMLVDENNIYDAVNIDILDRKAALFSEQGKLDSMMHYSHQALSMAKDQQNLHAQAVSHNELGYYFEHLPNLDSSYYHYNQAINIWSEIKALRYLANAQFNKARLLMKDNHPENAKVLLFQTEEISKGKGWYEIYPRLYEHIALIYQQEGDSAHFYKYKDKCTQAYFDSYHIENEKKIVELRSQLELEKSRDTIETQSQEIENLKADMENDKGTINVLYIAIAIISILVLIMLFLFLKLRKQLQQ